MAYYFGINVGDGSMGSVVEQASAPTKDVYIAIPTNANVPSKEELLLAAVKLMDYITVASKNW